MTHSRRRQVRASFVGRLRQERSRGGPTDTGETADRDGQETRQLMSFRMKVITCL